jgi:hypothetical protein
MQVHAAICTLALHGRGRSIAAAAALKSSCKGHGQGGAKLRSMTVNTGQYRSKRVETPSNGSHFPPKTGGRRKGVASIRRFTLSQIDRADGKGINIRRC